MIDDVNERIADLEARLNAEARTVTELCAIIDALRERVEALERDKK